MAETLQKALAPPVIVDHYIRTLALGECVFGVKRAVGNMLFVHIGHEVGAGIIANGSLWRGATGYAGEIAHLPVSEQEEATCRRGHSPLCLRQWIALYFWCLPNGSSSSAARREMTQNKEGHCETRAGTLRRDGDR